MMDVINLIVKDVASELFLAICGLAMVLAIFPIAKNGVEVVDISKEEEYD